VRDRLVSLLLFQYIQTSARDNYIQLTIKSQVLMLAMTDLFRSFVYE